MTRFVTTVILGGILLKPATEVPSLKNTFVRPVEARIVWGGGREANPVRPGDVSVTLSNGKTEMWTTHGGCVLAKVSKGGLVGWAHGTGLNRTQGLMDHELVIARNKKIIARIEAYYAFIEKWGFVADDTCVVICSRGPHGPDHLEKFRIKGGKFLAECAGYTPYEKMPSWAKPFVGWDEQE